MWSMWVVAAFADELCEPVVAILPIDGVVGVPGNFQPYVELDPCAGLLTVTIVDGGSSLVFIEEDFAGGELAFVDLMSGSHTLQVRRGEEVLGSTTFSVNTTLASIPPPFPPVFGMNIEEGFEARLLFTPVPRNDLVSITHLGVETVERVRSGIYLFTYPEDDHCFDLRLRDVGGSWSQPTTECGVFEPEPVDDKGCSTAGAPSWFNLVGLLARR